MLIVSPSGAATVYLVFAVSPLISGRRYFACMSTNYVMNSPCTSEGEVLITFGLLAYHVCEKYYSVRHLCFHQKGTDR